MPTGQAGLDNPSLTLSGDCVKLTIKSIAETKIQSSMIQPNLIHMRFSSLEMLLLKESQRFWIPQKKLSRTDGHSGKLL